MRVGRAGLIMILVVLTTGPGSGQESKPARGGKYALLIGVRKYAPDTLRNLPYTEADVTELAAVLERSGYARENITILTQTFGADDPGLLPLGSNVRAQLGIPERQGLPFKRGLKLGPLDGDDTLLVAFAGHGVQFDAEGESYFCPMDADLADEKSLIKLSDVSKALDGCKAGLKLLLVDACRNNPQIRANRAGERPVVDNPSLSRPFLRKPPGGTLALFSCSAGEVAFEDDDLKHGVFFHYVLWGIGGDPGLDGRGADLDGDGRVDANELARFAERNVFLHAGRRYRREQTVEVVNHTRGGVAIVDRRKVDPPIIMPERPRVDPGGTAARLDPKSITNTIGMKLMLIPAGEFQMGSDDGDKEAFDYEKPRHRVRITRAFYLGSTEVTQGQYRAVTGDSPSKYKGSEDLPVEQVSWGDAVAFCNKLSEKEGLKSYYQFGEGAKSGGDGYRLPTEAEWEYACRAGSTTRFHFGDEPGSLGEYDWFINNSQFDTHPVGQKRPNAFGLFDVHGNVGEWCSDWYDPGYYAQSPQADPAGPTQASIRVVRGGGWNNLPRDCRSAKRNASIPVRRDLNLGFRVARVRSGG